MSMPNINEVKTDVVNTLVGMGYNPTGLIITELITEGKEGEWKIIGEFKGTFMGQILKFEMRYVPQTRGFGNCKVYPISSEGGYA